MTQSRQRINLAIAIATTFGLAACGSEKAEQTAAVETVNLAKNAPEVTFKPSNADYDGTIAKPGSPYAISYRIVGTPLVGSPVIVELRVVSALGPRPVDLNYRINDASSMLLAESQPATVRMEPTLDDASFHQRVTVVPQREGRLYLNVSASFETKDGTVSTVMAVPIQVGTGTRELQEHGEVQLDENGEAVRVLSAE